MPAKQSASSKPAPPTKGERTHTAILDAAYALFLKNGYHGTSMRQIADQAGLALGGIYNHFGGKEDIFVAILIERHPFVHIGPALKEAQGDTIEELVCDAASRMIANLGKREEVLNLMFIEFVEFDSKHVVQLFETFLPQVMDFGEHITRARGTLRPIPLPVVMRAFVGLFFSYVMTEMLMGDLLPREYRQGAFDNFVDIYLHGVLAEG